VLFLASVRTSSSEVIHIDRCRWEPSQVQDWLTSIGFPNYAPDFDDIDGATLYEQGDNLDAWLNSYGLHNDMDRTQITRSWNAYRQRWRYAGDGKATHAKTKSAKLWKVAGAREVALNRVDKIFTGGSHTYSCQKIREAKIKVVAPGDYMNILDVLDLDPTKVRDRTKLKMETTSFKELLERRKKLRKNYYGTNKRVRKAHKKVPTLRNNNAATGTTTGGRTLSRPLHPSWKDKPSQGQFVDMNLWKSALPGAGPTSSRKLFLQTTQTKEQHCQLPQTSPMNMSRVHTPRGTMRETPGLPRLLSPMSESSPSLFARTPLAPSARSVMSPFAVKAVGATPQTNSAVLSTVSIPPIR
jgi:hypothetical protein